MANTSLVIIASLKIAILLEWIRIFVPQGTRNMAFWTSHGLIWVNALFSAVLIGMVNIGCEPYEYTWNRLIAGNCNRVSTATANLIFVIFSLVIDVLIFLIPQKFIWTLKTSTAEKIGVAVMVAVGLLGIGAAATRLALSLVRKDSEDISYNLSAFILTTAAEMTAAFLVVCLPIIFRRLLHGRRGDLESGIKRTTQLPTK